jgi:hypothetical protein
MRPFRGQDGREGLFIALAGIPNLALPGLFAQDSNGITFVLKPHDA